MAMKRVFFGGGAHEDAKMEGRRAGSFYFQNHHETRCLEYECASHAVEMRSVAKFQTVWNGFSGLVYALFG